MSSTICALLAIALLPSSFSFSTKSIHKHFRSPTTIHSHVDNFEPSFLISAIPNEISSTDQLDYVQNLPDLVLLPDTSIQALDGGSNLGAILWGFVLFNGFGITKLKPADWVLPLFALAFGGESTMKEQWYQDFKDGYYFDLPPTIELARAALFGLLGYEANQLWIASLGGDVFWGWATAMSLSIPSGLFALARSRGVTREYASIETEVRQNFKEFRTNRLVKTKGKKCNEMAIEMAFDRYCKRKEKDSPSTTVTAQNLSRTEMEKRADLRDKVLKKVIRTWVGYKPDIEGNYDNLEIIFPSPPKTIQKPSTPLSSSTSFTSSSSVSSSSGSSSNAVANLVSTSSESSLSSSSSSSSSSVSSVDSLTE